MRYVSAKEAKNFFECGKTDCKFFSDGIYIKADIICLYQNEELIEIFAASLEK